MALGERSEVGIRDVAMSSYAVQLHVGVRERVGPELAAIELSQGLEHLGGWEAMKGDMSGWFEVRIDGPKRHHYRLFCLLDYEAKGHDKPLLVVVDGRDKPFRTMLSDSDYLAVRAMGEEYLRRNPRSLV